MRKSRLLLPPAFGDAVYHAVSRVTDRRFIFGDEEKAKLVSLMRRYERFSGVRVLTFCIMSNHFHWLLEVPVRPANADSMPDEELVARVRRCQGKQAAFELKEALAYAVKRGYTRQHTELRSKWLARMWNLSHFVQTVKQRFSVWYNKRMNRKGTLWEERFKSVVALGAQAVASMAAYIDLNPVRAGLVEDPADYKWSGYGEATAGGRAAKEGLKRALCGRDAGFLEKGDKTYLDWYQSWICGRGVECGMQEGGKPTKRGLKAEVVEKVQQAQQQVQGKLPSMELLGKRVRHFTEGLVLGTGELLKEVFEAQRGYFGPARSSGPRKIRGGEWGELRAMRDLQKDVDTN